MLGGGSPFVEAADKAIFPQTGRGILSSSFTAKSEFKQSRMIISKGSGASERNSFGMPSAPGAFRLPRCCMCHFRSSNVTGPHRDAPEFLGILGTPEVGKGISL